MPRLFGSDGRARVYQAKGSGLRLGFKSRSDHNKYFFPYENQHICDMQIKLEMQISWNHRIPMDVQMRSNMQIS